MGIFPQSIRWRIQLWYLLLLAGIIAALLVAFYRNQREIKYQVLDRELNNPITRLLPRMERRRELPPRNRRLPRPDPLEGRGVDFEAQSGPGPEGGRRGPGPGPGTGGGPGPGVGGPGGGEGGTGIDRNQPNCMPRGHC